VSRRSSSELEQLRWTLIYSMVVLLILVFCLLSAEKAHARASHTRVTDRTSSRSHKGGDLDYWERQEANQSLRGLCIYGGDGKAIVTPKGKTCPDQKK